ncbi:MAG: hypothetical protein IPH81_06100 [Candidatus Microthrix sp.]|uniref:Uncharacterized protein n=1 Tax=Candidatus Neomicrothrix subdominans TaxID=2954438 RepID=A0A936NC38_9ACTN|nr:hypothetical protein [Candidatus Microthrix sp.]MBK9296104.1 hypothetical protein [Candidatus Microthrix subdominans]MBP7596843.1 hypothetical protein [Candidatus Microthrix sp.]
MITLDAATFMVAWATGMGAFLALTGRRREVGIGYGWTIRGTTGVLFAGAVVVGLRYEPNAVRDVAAALALITTVGVTFVSWQRRGAGVALQRERSQARSERVAQMTGIEKDEQVFDELVPEFPPMLDLIPVAFGIVALIAGGVASGGDAPVLSVARWLAGAAFLGAVSDGMLLGHWYLVQPGLPRAPLLELVRWVGYTWPVEVALFLVPVGMVSVFNGTIDDAYGGMLGWFWAASAVTTIVLVIVTRAALKERQYAAVMAATGLLYLAILTAFGTDLVARALLSGA